MRDAHVEETKSHVEEQRQEQLCRTQKIQVDQMAEKIQSVCIFSLFSS